MGQVMDTKTSKKICKGILLKFDLWLLKSRQTERPLKKGMRAHTELEKGLFLFCLAMGNIFRFFSVYCSHVHDMLLLIICFNALIELYKLNVRDRVGAESASLSDLRLQTRLIISKCVSSCIFKSPVFNPFLYKMKYVCGVCMQCFILKIVHI